VNKGGYSSNCKIVPAEFCIWWQNINYYFGHLWNRTTTKIFDIFRIFTLKQQNFSQSDPVLNANFQKNCSPIQSWSGQNWLQSWSNPIQSWSVLISDIYHIYLIWLVVLKRPGFQSQKYRMPTRGGTESGVPESTPAGFCVFLWDPDPDLESKICEKPDPHRSHSFISAVPGVCAVIS